MATSAGGLLYGSSNANQYKGTAVITNVATERQVKQVINPKKTVEVSNNTFPLIAVLDKLGRIHTIQNRKYTHVQGDILYMEATSSTAYTTETSIAVTAGQGVRLHVFDVLQNRQTQELIYITAISTDTLTVTRGFAGTTISNIASGAALALVTSSFGEASSKSNTSYREPNLVDGYTHIIRDGLAYSGNRLNLETYGGDTWAEDWKLTMQLHNRKKERAIILANGVLGAGGAQLTAGLTRVITTNYKDFAGTTPDETDINIIIMRAKRRNVGEDMICMCGENLPTVLNSFALDNLRYATDEKWAGIDIAGYVSYYGKLDLHVHGDMTADATPTTGTGDAMTNLPGPTAHGPEGMAYILNPKNLAIVKVGDRWNKRFDGIETPGDDAKEDGVLSEFGLQVEAEMKHMKLDGIPIAA